MAHTLRVLRALRGSSVAWPLTAGQLEALGDASMLQLLTQGRHHLLAMRIAEQLGAPRDKVGLGMCIWGGVDDDAQHTHTHTYNSEIRTLACLPLKTLL